MAIDSRPGTPTRGLKMSERLEVAASSDAAEFATCGSLLLGGVSAGPRFCRILAIKSSGVARAPSNLKAFLDCFASETLFDLDNACWSSPETCFSVDFGRLGEADVADGT